MGFFWSSTPNPNTTTNNNIKNDIPHPMNMSGLTPPPGCPMHKADDTTTIDDKLNPLTNMPELSIQKQPGQTIDLPTERTSSTIPRGDSPDAGVWEYPSPQQMFNAMVRKGKGDVPEDAVESMVNIHNFLNEGAWEEIKEWEKPYTEETGKQPRLLKFTGRPDTISPRARMYNYLSYIFPEKFGSELPFDRHDWTVLRNNGGDDWKQVRYVIDYYSGEDDPFGLPSFFLDVRPGLDNLDNAIQRFNHWRNEMKPTWDKAMGKETKTNDDDDDEY